MAKIPFGILGPFFGKTGTVSGYTWRGKAVMRSLREKSDKPPTAAQLRQQGKFKFITQFLNGLGPLVKTSFREQAGGNTEFQCAMSYNLANAVSGVHPHLKLHYDLVSVGRGTLPNAVLPEAKVEAGAQVRFIWADNTGIGLAAADDKAVPVAYCPAKGEWEYELASGARRADGSVVFDLDVFAGEEVHTWLTFVSEAGKTACSVYTGRVVLV